MNTDSFESGFSVIELLVAAALGLVVIGTTASLVEPAQKAFKLQLEAADVQQRLRVAVDRLRGDLMMAGAGSYASVDAGPLVNRFAPLLPYRVGQSAEDPPGTFSTDSLTVWYVPETAAQTTLSSPIDSSTLTLRVQPSPSCPAGQPVCGVSAGMTIAIYDRAGHFDSFRVSSVGASSAALTVNRADNRTSARFEIGANVSQVVQRSYYLRMSPQGFKQLVYSDGSGAGEVPVVDHVVDLQFAYFGDPQPPIVRRPSDEEAAALTSYGPPPPEPDEQPTLFPIGENCAFRRDGLPVPRQIVLGGDADGHALVPLAEAELADGDIWCPDFSVVNRFDVDLLRIRKIAVRIKVESALDALRGPAGVLFSRAGTAADGRQFLPDKELQFQITPPNLGGGH